MVEFSAREEVLLRFSLKEALFKAIHPVVERFIGLRDVEIHPCDDGTAEICFHRDTTPSIIYDFPCGDGGWKFVDVDAAHCFMYEARWIKLCDSYIISAVKMIRV